MALFLWPCMKYAFYDAAGDGRMDGGTVHTAYRVLRYDAFLVTWPIFRCTGNRIEALCIHNA